MKSVNELKNMKEFSSAWLQKITGNENKVVFKLNSASQVNVIPKPELLK